MSPTLRALVLLLGAGSSLACATSAVPVRVLSSQTPMVLEPQPEPTPSPANALQAPDDEAELPRIGAPGGSGAGSRRVAPL